MAPETLTYIILVISVVALAMNTQMNKAKIIMGVMQMRPIGIEAVITAKAINNVVANGEPRILATIDAKVCSSQVTGIQ